MTTEAAALTRIIARQTDRVVELGNETNRHAYTANRIAYAQLLLDLKLEEEASTLLIDLAPEVGFDYGNFKAPDDDALQADPASEDFEEEVDKIARRLWLSDPKNNTPARSFGEDYGDAQDRYRTLARVALDPTAGKDAQR